MEGVRLRAMRRAKQSWAPVLLSLSIVFLLLITLSSLINGPPNDEVYRWEQYAKLREDIERNRRHVISHVVPTPILVQGVELYPRENAKLHNTHLYDLLKSQDPPLIIRRGQNFYLAIRFKKTFRPTRDTIRLHFEFGSPPYLQQKGNLISLPLTIDVSSFTRERSLWDIRTHQHEGTVITIDVQVAGSAPVGVWKMKILSYVTGDLNAPPEVFEIPQNVYILFNPWSTEDTVFLDKEDARREYVLNDVGKIFGGTQKEPSGRKWIYGQFADSVLPAVMLMLNHAKLDYMGRASPILVSRAISKLVNRANDDKDIVVGNWSGMYDDGKAPRKWTGSAAIMDEYFKNGGEKSVRYGQYWVFAGVCTTVFRTLGIPCRTVTNFVSARDADRSLTVDKYFDEKGEKIKGVSNDLVWNFHVWNDCWMTRPDLPLGYGGWQSIDSTPATSGNVFQMGPASVEAVRRGQVGFDFDCSFVFAEVNADIIKWTRDETVEGGWRKAASDKYKIGQFILTKKIGVDDDVGNTDAENIVGEYKYQEGTMEERMAVLNAARLGMAPSIRYAVYDMPTPEAEDVELDLLEIDKIMIGQPFQVTVKVRNKNKTDNRTVSAWLSASTVYYTGVLARKITRQRGSFTLKPNQVKELSVTVSPDDYLDKLVEYAMIKIYTIATVQETQQTWAEEDDFALQKPKLSLESPDALKVGLEFQLVIRMTNPLNRQLTDCLFTIEGPGLSGPNRVKFKDVAPLESVVHFERLVPKRPGKRTILVNFSSRQLIEVLGSKNVTVIQ